jgi:hypothetical protein
MTVKERNKKLETPTIIAIVIAIIILAILILSALWTYQMQNTKPSASEKRYAQIRQNGEVIQTVDLTEEREAYQFRIESEDGGYNVVEVRDGGIGIVEASCPDGTCMNTGFVSGVGIPIVCLPNKIVIEIVSQIEETASTDSGVDVYVR